MAESSEFIDAGVAPSGNGCVECDENGGWWVHLRRCALCGHVGCCDESLLKHATRHFEATGHRVIRTYEPGEEWFFDYLTGAFSFGPRLAPPLSHPADQSVPGPADRLPANWEDLLAEDRDRR